MLGLGDFDRELGRRPPAVVLKSDLQALLKAVGARRLGLGDDGDKWFNFGRGRRRMPGQGGEPSPHRQDQAKVRDAFIHLRLSLFLTRIFGAQFFVFQEQVFGAVKISLLEGNEALLVKQEEDLLTLGILWTLNMVSRVLFFSISSRLFRKQIRPRRRRGEVFRATSSFPIWGFNSEGVEASRRGQAGIRLPEKYRQHRLRGLFHDLYLFEEQWGFAQPLLEKQGVHPDPGESPSPPKASSRRLSRS